MEGGGGGQNILPISTCGIENGSFFFASMYELYSVPSSHVISIFLNTFMFCTKRVVVLSVLSSFLMAATCKVHTGKKFQDCHGKSGIQ